MVPETEAELFQYWRNLGRTPERLIEHFLSTHNIDGPESKTRLERIIKYARLLEKISCEKGEVNAK